MGMTGFFHTFNAQIAQTLLTQLKNTVYKVNNFIKPKITLTDSDDEVVNTKNLI